MEEIWILLIWATIYSYNTTGALPCRGCGDGFKGNEIVKAFDGRRWHLRCLMCKACGRKFEDGSEAKAVRELPYCPGACYEKAALVLCGGCQNPITEGSFLDVKQLSKKFHPGCFKCGECGKEIDASKGFKFNKGSAYCSIICSANANKKAAGQH